MKTKNTCLFPECVNPSYTRGLCMNHYRTARYAVNSGKTTWGKLEKAGKTKPARAGRHSQTLNHFLTP